MTPSSHQEGGVESASFLAHPAENWGHLKPSKCKSITDHQNDFDRVVLEGGEGLVIKGPSCPYEPEKRSSSWVKISLPWSPSSKVRSQPTSKAFKDDEKRKAQHGWLP